MQYKTMVLGLLQQRPNLARRLRKARIMLWTMNDYAALLKVSHEHWKNQLGKTRPDTSPQQIASEALELALQELEASLPTESQPSDDPLSLDAAMAHISSHTPPA